MRFFDVCTTLARVSATEQFDDPTVCRLDTQRKMVEPCSIVIFGASGDLTSRKLIPALYHLFKEKQLPPAFRIIGVARREKTDESFRMELREALGQFSRTQPVEDTVWHEVAHYFGMNELQVRAAERRRRG